MKILHLITSLDAGGAQAMLAKLLLHMDRHRFTNTVVSLKSGGVMENTFRIGELCVFSLRMEQPFGIISGLWQLRQILRREQPDLIQCWLYHANLVGLFAKMISPHSRLLWNIRCSKMEMQHYRIFSALVERIIAWCSAFPDVVIANSRIGIAEHKGQGFHPRRWEYIPNGFDVSQFSPSAEVRRSLRAEWNIGERQRLVGIVARLDPMKDHQTFLQAAALLAKRRDDVSFVCVGDGAAPYVQKLRELGEKYGLRHCLQWLGYRSDMPAVYNACDVMVLSSAFGEGFPNVVGEAMSCGIPCVVTNVGDAADVVGHAGIIVPRRDPEALATGIDSFLEKSEHEKRKYSDVARQRIVKLFSLDVVVQMYQTLYTTLVEQSVCVDSAVF